MNWQALLSRPSTTDEVGPTDARARHAEGARLIDVREPHEYEAGHAPGAEMIPLGQLAYRLQELPRDRDVLFICRSGNRSGVATGMARRAGMARAVNVKGGMIAWSQGGLPVEK